jgi:hypothetical protein
VPLASQLAEVEVSRKTEKRSTCASRQSASRGIFEAINSGAQIQIQKPASMSMIEMHGF